MAKRVTFLVAIIVPAFPLAACSDSALTLESEAVGLSKAQGCGAWLSLVNKSNTQWRAWKNEVPEASAGDMYMQLMLVVVEQSMKLWPTVKDPDLKDAIRFVAGMAPEAWDGIALSHRNTDFNPVLYATLQVDAICGMPLGSVAEQEHFFYDP